MSAPQTLRLRDFLGPGQRVHVARALIDRRYTPSLHTHDFYEVFWVIEGAAQHTINGKSHRLRPHTAWLIRPEDVHRFACVRGQHAAFINLAVSKRTVHALRDRYFGEGKGEGAGNRAGPSAWPWAVRSAAHPIAITPRLTQQLTDAAIALAARKDNPLAVDRFLLNLLDELPSSEARATTAQTARETSTHAAPARSPDWLRDALAQCHDDPDALREGVGALALHSERSREHVARTMRDTMGCTPTQYITRLRMQRAGQALTLSSRSITDIAADVGLENLSHFYRLFSEHFGTTPRRYRAQQQRVLGGT